MTLTASRTEASWFTVTNGVRAILRRPMCPSSVFGFFWSRRIVLHKRGIFTTKSAGFSVEFCYHFIGLRSERWTTLRSPSDNASSLGKLLHESNVSTETTERFAAVILSREL